MSEIMQTANLAGTLKPQQSLSGSVGIPDKGVSGKDGLSAYDIAVANGFVGTVKEWLESLNGKDGETGPPGNNGLPSEFSYSKIPGGHLVNIRDYRHEEEFVIWDGEDGYTPQKGVDYFTDLEKSAFVQEVTDSVNEEIGLALDEIIAIQNDLIGGDTE